VILYNGIHIPSLLGGRISFFFALPSFISICWLYFWIIYCSTCGYFLHLM